MTSHRVIDMVEEYAREQIRRAAARVTLNTGFARAGTRAFNVLADVMRKYLQQMWLRAKMVAEHGLILALLDPKRRYTYLKGPLGRPVTVIGLPRGLVATRMETSLKRKT